MKTAVRTNFKSKTFSPSKSYSFFREREIDLVNIKLYQKLFVIFISMSTFLIFPDSPKQLEKVCISYNSREICNVW